MVLVSIVLLSIGAYFVVDNFYLGHSKQYEYSTTDFIEPEERFVTCVDVDDCFKFQGSACPATAGGVEVCINKNFVQEYRSIIEDETGILVDIDCPQVDMSTDRECGCILSRCELMGV